MIQLYSHLKVQINRKGVFGLLAKILSVFFHEGPKGISRRISRMMVPVESVSPLLRLMDKPDERFFESLTKKSAAWPSKPLISILMPVYGSDQESLHEAMHSVLNQAYPKWELCIVAAASSQLHLKRALDEYQGLDFRIKVTWQDLTDNVSHFYNGCLTTATGAFTVLFQADHLLERQALFRVAESINEDWPDIIYSDEVSIAVGSSEVIMHQFRPGFSPELLRSHPYIGNLVVFRTELLRHIGGFDEDLAISQHYDLVLRAAEQAKTIVHIPEILYRRRKRGDSVNFSRQNEVMETSRIVLAAHLARCGEKAEVHPGKVFPFMEVRYVLEAGLRVAIIIPTKNHGDLVRQCIDSIVRTVTGVNYDIVVVDHVSDETETLIYLDELALRHKLLRYKGSFNFSAINNWAIKQLGGGYSHYLLCNNDIQAISPGWLNRMLELGQKPDVGMVGAKLLYPDGRTLQHAGVCVGLFSMAEHYGKFMDRELPDGDGINPGYIGSLIANRETSAVTAACMLIRRDAFEWTGGFDENIQVGFGDVDLCLRARQAGYRVLFCAHAELLHHESYSRGKSPSNLDPHPDDTNYFGSRWRRLIDDGDPYYNPNLSLNDTLWSLKEAQEVALEVGKKTGRRVFRKHPGFKEIY